MITSQLLYLRENGLNDSSQILKKFGYSTVKAASTPTETSKPFLEDKNAKDVDVHLYRSMICSLMYFTSSRPDIIFVVCAYARFQVTPKVSHIYAVKRIFRYLKGQPKLGLWYPKDSPFDLEAYNDSDYAGASFDRKFTTGEYVAAANCCGQVLWIQNQMLDYGYNFINTKIFIDNESTICIVKNLVFHSKTKHIEIMHHFIRDSYEKRLIQVIKIYTYQNIADLLIKAFDNEVKQLLRMELRLTLNYMQQPMPNPEDITYSTTAMNIALSLMAKAFKLNNSTPTNNNQRISSNLRNRQIAQLGQNARNLNGYNAVQNVGNQGNAAGHNGNQIRCYNCRGLGHFARDCTVRPRRRDAAYLQTQLLIAQKEEAGIQLQAEEYDLMAAAADLDEIEENQIGNGNLVAACTEGNAAGPNGNQIRCYNYRGFGHYPRNCTARLRRRDAAYLQTQLLIAQKEEARIQLQAEEYDLMAAAAYLDEIEEYTELLEPIPESHQVPQNDNEVISEVTGVEQGGETV
nr:hypothetical protein [Tanacetum cinerariifolium]